MSFVFEFKKGKKGNINELGNIGEKISFMSNNDINYKKGFILTTEACKHYLQSFNFSEFEKAIFKNLKRLEKTTGKKLGDLKNPLLLSLKSTTKQELKGLLNCDIIGINDEIYKELSKDNKKQATLSYLNLIKSYAVNVCNHESNLYRIGEDLNASLVNFKNKFKEMENQEFPQDINKQFLDLLAACFLSWNNERAYVLRDLYKIPFEDYLAVVVQVAEIENNKTVKGKIFTRDILTGENNINGFIFVNDKKHDLNKLNKIDSENYENLINFAKKLEKNYKDVQEIDFEIQNGNLYILKSITTKKSKMASLKIAVNLAEEKIISKTEAIMRIKPSMIDYFLHTQFDVDSLKKSTQIAKGLPASPGAGAGKICFSPEKTKELLANKEKAILVCFETSPEDIEGMAKVQGVLTAKGGMTSHAAVVARGMGTTCVVGCEAIKFSKDGKTIQIDDKTYKEGDIISIDGNTGIVYDGEVSTLPASSQSEFTTILSWADEHSKLQVRANADNPKDANNAYNFGAKGVGLCRTEHMFFEKDRIRAVREMIVASSQEERVEALSKILPMQKNDFIGIYKAMKGYPVTIRFLDPPLHEFLPKEDSEIKELASGLGITFEKLKQKVEDLHEFNPMMGHRGLRLAVTYPEIAQMQTQAVIEAAIEVNKEMNYNIVPEIMIPLTSSEKELKYVRDIVSAKADEIIQEKQVDLTYKIGTMIEIPRACVTADEIAKQAEFFSFGTNDLTQMTYGFSRDDAGKFLDDYYSKDILECNPFGKLDQTGVGELVKMACKKGKKTRPDIKLGICGEHGGEPSSIEFCHKAGLDYVSCSPYRVPVARIATAQANIKNLEEFTK